MKKNLIILFLLTLPAVSSIFRSGFFPMQDDLQAFRLKEMQSCFLDGQFPCRWTPLSGYGYGYPLFQYYAPAIFYFGQPFLFLGIQAIDTVKLLLILAVFTGSYGMFFLIRRLNGPELLVATIYTYLPYHAQQLYVRGALNELWAMAIYPWVVFYFLRVRANPSIRRLAVFALSLALLFTTHNLMSIFILPVLLIYVDSIRSFIKLTLGGLLAAAMAAFFLLPLIFENSAAHLETLTGGYFGFRQHFVSLSQLLLDNTWGYGSSQLGIGDDLALSVSLVLWPLALLLSVNNIARRRIDRTQILLLSLAGSFLFLIHERSSFIWEILTPLSWLQFPWRLLLPVGFILSLCVSTLPRRFILLPLVLILVLHGSFFTPKSWQFTITDSQKFSEPNLTVEQTRSVFDYLPKSAILPPNQTAPSQPEILDTLGSVSLWRKGSNWQQGQLTLAEPSVVRFPIYDFPGMQVTINDAKVPHTNNDCRGQDYCFGLISSTLPAGTNNVDVRLTKTEPRLVGDIISISALFLVLVFLCLG